MTKTQFRGALALPSRPIASFYSALTLGSSIVRTAVDHETAIHSSNFIPSLLSSASFRSREYLTLFIRLSEDIQMGMHY